MSETTFDVRIWDIREKVGRPRKNGKPGKKSYTVRWVVAKKEFPRTFATRPLADGFRSRLVSAQKGGEAFRVADGMPVSMARELDSQPWFAFAQRYVDMKWPRAAAKSRSGNADTMATATMAMLAGGRGKPDDKVLRKAMTGWAFNTGRRDSPKPVEIEQALRWLAVNTVPVSALDDPAAVRRVLDQIALKMDGKPAAAKTVARKRAVFYNAIEYASELKLVTVNRIREVKWTAPKEVKAIDKRAVISPRHAELLLSAVAAQFVEGQPRRSSGPMLVAYFGVQYYSALRPEEAAMLSEPDLLLPEDDGWGDLLLSKAAPTAGAAWTDTGERREVRHLKQRGKGEVRTTPCPPPLTKLLHWHLKTFGAAPDGRLFRSLNGGMLSESTVSRVWDNARRTALTAEEYASPMGLRPYDLRHACVSTWLAAGIQPPQVAEWAGHSVAVLLQIYAAIIAGMEAASREKIGRILGLP